MSLFALNRLVVENHDVERQILSHAPLDRFDPTRTNVSPTIKKPIGLSIGVDAGSCYLTPIVSDLTTIVSSIVRSTRVCNSCPRYHLVLNVYPGSRLPDGMTAFSGRLSKDLVYQVESKSISTKEYSQEQVAYSVEFFRKWKRLLFRHIEKQSPQHPETTQTQRRS